jgi:hypothetical protein
MKAELVFHDKQVLTDGAIVEMKIWQLATPVLRSAHRLKCSLFHELDGRGSVDCDNERGTGKHRHIEGKQERYEFTSVERLMADFLADVRRLRGEE